ncbi:hypothetical protein BC827DRAFT_1274389 [Russula dissimulans]|nr:hypothetical protein BC827DRAFT_1274389 [Russula dissimulans]
MNAEQLPDPITQPAYGRSFRRWRPFLRSYGSLRTGLFFGVIALSSLVIYATFLSPHDSLWRRPTDWYGLPQRESLASNPKYHHSPSPSPTLPHTPDPPVPTETTSSWTPWSSDALTLEQLRDVVAPTRGFFTRDYSLGLGWNNMRYILDAALIQSQVLKRTLIIPSFVYARACEFELKVCASYSTMVNKNDAIGEEEWRDLPYEQQMGFRIPISVMIDLPRLRARHPVVTASEYLRLHGQDPESESSSGYWDRDSYISHPYVFESNKTKTPTQFVIENHWYDPQGTNRVDYIPQSMKNRGKWERHPGPEIGPTAGYWPDEEPTEISIHLTSLLPEDKSKSLISWDTAKTALNESQPLGLEVDLDNDKVVEQILNDNGWEVLHTFESVLGMEFAKSVVQPIKEVVPRSTIRGFKEDYYHVDADVVVLAGETHLGRKPGAMRFSEVSSRAKYADMVVHDMRFPPKVFALADALAARMQKINGGRLWMGAHMRRGDFVRAHWVMESTLADHVQRVKDRLNKGRELLTGLSNISAYPLEDTKPDMEQVTLPPPLPDDKFYVATDERDPEALKAISEGGAIFFSDLITIDDRRAFGWPLIITDVRAIVEQAVLMHSAYFYGHAMSSLAGVIMNLRGARGADPRTVLLD